MGLRFVLVLGWLAAGAAAADFNFNVLIRAGVSGGDWEVGMGLNSAGVPSVSGYLTPHWQHGTLQRFEIGYTQATGQAYTRVYSPASLLLLTVLYTVPNATPLGAGGTWTLPAGAFYTRASANPTTTTSVTASGMSLSPGLGVLNPPSLTASSAGGGQTVSQNSPILFQTMSGDWVLSGDLTWSGIAPAVAGGAMRSQLQFGLTAQASDAPEPASVLLVAGALAYLRLRRAR